MGALCVGLRIEKMVQGKHIFCPRVVTLTLAVTLILILIVHLLNTVSAFGLLFAVEETTVCHDKDVTTRAFHDSLDTWAIERIFIVVHVLRRSLLFRSLRRIVT